MRQRWDYAIVVAACVVPRAGALLHERGAILAAYVEKSDVLARVFLSSGTFGYIPGEPTASTQPLYGFFLIPIYWLAGRHWWSLGAAQLLVAAGTSLIVYETGRRFVSRPAGLLAAVVATLQPYLVWHDIHANREILDQFLGAAVFLLTLIAAKRRTLPVAALLGIVAGVAILSNSRLLLLPLALAGYLLWRGAGWAAVTAVPVLAVVALAPWVVRNKVQVGCVTITTDARALWKANNLATYRTLQDGNWIDSVPDFAGRAPTPQDAGTIYDSHHIDLYRSTNPARRVDECAQQSFYERRVLAFWAHHPGAKAKLMLQATWMLWDPRVGLDAGSLDAGGTLHSLRRWVEPVYMVPLYVLAIVGLFLVTPAVRVLALLFAGYETLGAWVFAGTTRYRVSWDFVLALLAGAALARLPLRRPASQYR